MARSLKNDFRHYARDLQRRQTAFNQKYTPDYIASLAAQPGGQDVLAGLIKEVAALHDATVNPPFKAVFTAVSNDSLKGVKKHIEEKNIHPDARNFGGSTLLMYAAGNGNLAVVKYLLAQGANPNARDNRGWTPLAMAASKDHAGVFKILLQAGANPRALTKERESRRVLAERNNAYRVLGLLDDKGALVRLVSKTNGAAPKP